MRLLDLTLPTPAENLAVDEVLLDWAEEQNKNWEFLRLWESKQPMVVVGRSTRVAEEVHEGACRERGIPILRRASGGAAIVAGPGCLMYAVVLSYHLRPELKDIRRAHQFVLDRLAAALRPALAPKGIVQHAGTSDLVFEQHAHAPWPRKFSGNSLRAKRSHLLYHGTLLYDFELPLVERCLRMPPRQPDYRNRRDHRDFVANVPIARQPLRDAVLAAWPTTAAVTGWPADRVAQLVFERFGRDQWNYEFA